GYANAKAQIRLEQGRLLVRIADTLAGAPDDVHEALAEILLSKLYRKPVSKGASDRYRRYLNRGHVRRNLDLVRQIRGRKSVDNPAGRYFDLKQLFEGLNFKYFFGLMARPEIGWSRQVSKSQLGHYDPSHNTIVINRMLDKSQVPLSVVEYVLYHEMLHLRHPVEHRGGRRCVHTPAF